MSAQPESRGNNGRAPRRRIAAGPPRPEYLGGGDVDRVTIMMVAMLSELLALRERVETHEDLLDRQGVLTKEAIEAYRPSAETEDVREAARLAILRRVFRVLRDEFADNSFEESDA